MAWTPGKGGASRYNTPESNGGGETFVRIKDEGDSERMALLMPPFETYFGVSSYKDKDGNDKPSTVVNYPCTLDGSTLAFWGSGRAGEKALAGKIKALAKRAAKPGEPTDEHYAEAERTVYGHWLEVTRQGSGPTTTYTFEVGEAFDDREAVLEEGAGLLDSLVAKAGASADECKADGFGSVARRITQRLADYGLNDEPASDDDLF